MIVKVQLPLGGNDPKPPALVYDQTRTKLYYMMQPEELPDAVRAVVVAAGGKAFFHVLKRGDQVLFGEEAEPQTW